MQAQEFGSIWTKEKLIILEKYLIAYTTALKDKFYLNYIDAFAGSGFCQLKRDTPSSGQLCFYQGYSDAVEFIEGSARLALKVQPCFSYYYFIDIEEENIQSLKGLINEFPNFEDRMKFISGDANEQIIKLCDSINWNNNRAVMLLDPFAMQVNWTTIKRIARTNSVDLWYLFPINAVNRLLKRDGNIPTPWRVKLDNIFGTSEWFDHFYKAEDSKNEQFSFDQYLQDTNDDIKTESGYVKMANFESIKKFFIKRLKKEFVGVSDTPRVLYNQKKNIPLFLFCFACSNKAGKEPALRIANHILSRDWE